MDENKPKLFGTTLLLQYHQVALAQFRKLFSIYNVPTIHECLLLYFLV